MKRLLSLFLAQIIIFTPITASAYAVVEPHWAKETIENCIDSGFFDGFISYVYKPETKVTRSMFVTALYNLSGETISVFNSKFKDLDRDKYYFDAVIWANENGIIKGVSETKFAPDDYVTREQMATILDNFIKHTGILPLDEVLDFFKARVLEIKNHIFADDSSISSYAKESIKNMRILTLINGRTGNNFAPKETMNIGELSKIIYDAFSYMLAFKVAE